MRYLCNAFSLQMVLSQLKNPGDSVLVRVTALTKDEAAMVLKEADFTSAIGHADTAAVVSDALQVNAECNRCFVTLNNGDVCVVAQVKGGRLPEGATKLPEGMDLGWYFVELA